VHVAADGVDGEGQGQGQVEVLLRRQLRDERQGRHTPDARQHGEAPVPAPLRSRLRPEGERGVQEGYVHKEGASRRQKFVFGVQHIAPVQGGFVQSEVALQGGSSALLGPFGGVVQGSAPTEAGCFEPLPKRRRLHHKQPAPLFTAYL